MVQTIFLKEIYNKKMNNTHQYENKFYKSVNQYIFKVFIFITFLIHSLYYTSKIGNYWDEIHHIETGGSAIKSVTEFLKNTSPDQQGAFFYPEYYGSIFLAPQHLITKIIFDGNYLFDFLIDNYIVLNKIDYYFYIRHVILIFFVTVSFIFISLMVDSLIGLKAGNIFLLLTLFFPRFLGHSLFNALDIPFAIFILLAFTYFFYKSSRKDNILNFSNSDLLKLSILFAFILCVRGNGFVFIASLFFYIIFFQIQKQDIGKYLIISSKLFIFTLIFSLMFSPKSWANPFLYLQGVYRAQFRNEWSGSTLTNGQFIMGQASTYNYLLVWLFFTIPIIYFLYISIFLIRNKNVQNFSYENFSLFFVIYVLTLHAIFRPISYNGIRHYLFIIPFLSLICSYGYKSLNSKKIQLLLLFSTIGYLAITQYQFDQYKYSYFNEFVSSESITEYCPENINGCGNWGTDYYAISGKEFSNLIDNYEDDIDNLFVCYPTKSLTPYLSNTDKFNEPYLWDIKSDAPAHNETDGFKQFKIVYSEGHFRDFINNQNIYLFYTYSIQQPQKYTDTCSFYLYNDTKEFSCEYVDSINRNVRGNKVAFSYLSKCLMKDI